MRAPSRAGDRQIDSIFFDVDGTLVDSNDAHASAWSDAFKVAGKDVAFATIRPLIGMGTDKILATLATGIEPGTPAAQQLSDRRKSIFLDRYLPQVRALPGARDLLQACRTHDLACIVASAASPAELDPLLEIAQVTDLVDHIVRADEVESSKPDPDIIEAALRWHDTSPARALMVGDTRFDVDAAHRAGVRCFALRSGGAPGADLRAADAVFESPAELAGILRATSLDDLIARLSS